MRAALRPATGQPARMKRRRRCRDDLLDVLLEIRSAEERGDPMPPVQCLVGSSTGWTVVSDPDDDHTDERPADVRLPSV